MSMVIDNFSAEIGAEAIKIFIRNIDLEANKRRYKAEIKETKVS